MFSKDAELCNVCKRLLKIVEIKKNDELIIEAKRKKKEMKLKNIEIKLKMNLKKIILKLKEKCMIY